MRWRSGGGTRRPSRVGGGIRQRGAAHAVIGRARLPLGGPERPVARDELDGAEDEPSRAREREVDALARLLVAALPARLFKPSSISESHGFCTIRMLAPGESGAPSASTGRLVAGRSEGSGANLDDTALHSPKTGSRYAGPVVALVGDKSRERTEHLRSHGGAGGRRRGGAIGSASLLAGRGGAGSRPLGLGR